jgi:hypothetical protein
MGKLQRERGASTEREISTYLSEQLGVTVRRKLGQARDSGEDISVPPYRIEVKRRKKIATLAFLKQCEVGCDDSEIPVVVMRVDGDLRPTVMLRLEDFVFLMRETMVAKPAGCTTDG